MEGAGSNIRMSDEEKAFKGLVDAFSQMFSPEEIGSAYLEAKKDADAAGLILYDKLEASADRDALSVPNSSLSDNLSSESSSHDMSCNPTKANGNSTLSKPKLPPASIGTVSSFLGKDYVTTKPPAKRFSDAAKPSKLDPESLPVSALSIEEDQVDSKANQMQNEMEEFLFKMLGEGFQLDRHVIRDVLGKCGYDMQKSMERLFDYSASSLEKRKKIQQGSSLKSKDSYGRNGAFLQHKMIQHPGTGSQGLGVSSKDEQVLPRKLDRDNLQKEVLAALFSSSKRHENLPSTAAAEKSEACSRVVGSAEELVESPENLTPADESNMVNSKLENFEEDEEDSYQALRKAVQEYRNTMKEYYTAAIEAFQTGDQVRASKLLEKGSFFQQKAREADDESAEKILETSKNEDTQDSMTLTLDLHEYEPREAIRLLRDHLSSLAGTPAFKYLKVTIETADVDTSNGSRRRRIMRLLERDSLEWAEEGTAGTILIPLGNINRRRLSFVKK